MVQVTISKLIYDFLFLLELPWFGGFHMLSVVNFVGGSNGFVIVRLVALWVMHIGDW